MATVSSGILGEANLLNLKSLSNDDVRSEVRDFLVPEEKLIQSFHTVRDQVIFTNKRIIVVNVQGLVGKKASYFIYPYSRVQYFAIETAGLLDIDSELTLMFSDGNCLQFDFKTSVDIKQLCTVISACILK